MGLFCALCLDETTLLVRDEDGYLECDRCRLEHPRVGGYSFGNQGREAGLVEGAHRVAPDGGYIRVVRR